MKCEEVKSLFFLYLDSELDPRSVQEVNLHLEVCPSCRERWSFETALEESVTRAGASAHGSRGDFDWSELGARVEASTQRATETRTSSTTYRQRLLALGVAAGFLLVTFGIWVQIFSTTRVSAVAHSAAAHHEKYLAGKSPIQVSGSAESVAEFFAGELSFPVRVPGSDSFSRLVGARRCSFLGEPVAYVAYEIGGRPVTVILGPRHPPEALMDAIAVAPDGILEENVREYGAIFSTAHGIFFGAVGHASFAELEALLAAFRKDPRAPPPSLLENAASRSENPGR